MLEPSAGCGTIMVRNGRLLEVHELRRHRLQLTVWLQLPVWRGRPRPRLLTLLLLVNWKRARPGGAEPQRSREGHGFSRATTRTKLRRL